MLLWSGLVLAAACGGARAAGYGAQLHVYRSTFSFFYFFLYSNFGSCSHSENRGHFRGQVTENGDCPRKMGTSGHPQTDK